MGTEEDRRLEQSTRIGIILFVVVVVLIGIIFIVWGTTQYHDRDIYYEMVFTSIGATLIAVGVVDVSSQLFVRPSLVSTMRRSFPLFSDKTKVPKETLRKLMIEIAGLLSPRAELKTEFEQFFDQHIVHQFHEFIREDFKVSIKLGIRTMNAGKAVDVEASWTYDVHNITNETKVYPVNFRCSTYSFLSRNLALKDHIRIEKIQVTRPKKPNDPEDIGKDRGIYTLQPKKVESAKVQLKLEEPLKVEIESLEKVTIFVKYRYVAENCDDHTQRMSKLTRNLHLTIDFNPNEFFVDVDEFCIPQKNTIEKAHSYVWKGWFMPNHGFIVEWKPKDAI